jgi:hypothetical protein
MKKQYKYTKLPFEAWENFNKKKIVLNDIAKEEFKQSNLKISLADTFRFFSQKPIYVYNDEFIKFFLKEKKSKFKGFKLK